MLFDFLYLPSSLADICHPGSIIFFIFASLSPRGPDFLFFNGDLKSGDSSVIPIFSLKRGELLDTVAGLSPCLSRFMGVRNNLFPLILALCSSSVTYFSSGSVSVGLS